MSREATERRLRSRAIARFEPEEEIVVWCRAWVSKVGHFQSLAPRWRDVAVVTDRRFLLFGVGHFTRRPRRRVLADRLDELSLADVGAHPGRGLRCARPGRPPMLLELGTDPWSRKLAQELQDRARGDSSPAEEAVASDETPAAAEPAVADETPESPET
jgi:hypothetical protein